MDDRLLQRINDLLNVEGSAPSSWEIDFLESLEVQVRTGKELSDKQMAKLDEIEERRND